MPEIQITKVPEIRWYRRPPYSAVDQLRLIGGLKGVNTMSKFEGKFFWHLCTLDDILFGQPLMQTQ